MREIYTANREGIGRNILKLLKSQGRLSVGEISWELETAPEEIDSILAELQKINKVVTKDYIFWELGEKPFSLIVLCGPSHAGKSTYAGRLEDFVVVNSDEIRERLKCRRCTNVNEKAVWETFELLKRTALLSGDDVVLDACHMSEKARWHSVQGPNDRHRKVCVVFDMPLRAIRERCLKDSRLPVAETERMWRDFQDSKPSEEELKELGFDEVVWVMN